MPVISRHRLPEPYRSLLCGLWLTPPALMFLTLIKLNGLTWAVFHPLTLLAGVLMALPAWYVWQQGVDVMPDALHIRITGWRRRTFDQLDTWTLAPNPPDEPILLVWDRQRRPQPVF